MKRGDLVRIRGTAGPEMIVGRIIDNIAYVFWAWNKRPRTTCKRVEAFDVIGVAIENPAPIDVDDNKYITHYVNLGVNNDDEADGA